METWLSDIGIHKRPLGERKVFAPFWTIHPLFQSIGLRRLNPNENLARTQIISFGLWQAMAMERQDALSNCFEECKSVRGTAYTWEVKASFPSLTTGMQRWQNKRQLTQVHMSWLRHRHHEVQRRVNKFGPRKWGHVRGVRLNILFISGMTEERMLEW